MVPEMSSTMVANSDVSPESSSLTDKLEALRTEVRDLKIFAERQQDSISSLIALSQQHTSIIEQQNLLIQKLTATGTTGLSSNSFTSPA